MPTIAQVETHFVPQFTANLESLMQDHGGRLDGAYMWGPYYGKFAQAVNYSGTGEFEKVQGRDQDIVPYELPTEARYLTPEDFDFATRLARTDKIRMIVEPLNQYVRQHASAWGRLRDKAALNCMYADAKTGDGTATTSFPASQIVSASEGSNGTTGMNVDKIKAVLALFHTADADLENDEIHAAMTAKQNLELLRQIEVIHGDYSRMAEVKIVRGWVREYLGITFHHKEKVIPKSGSNRLCPFWLKSQIHGGFWPEEINVEIDRVRNKRGKPWEVYSFHTLAFTRTQETGVVQVPCLES